MLFVDFAYIDLRREDASGARLEGNDTKKSDDVTTPSPLAVGAGNDEGTTTITSRAEPVADPKGDADVDGGGGGREELIIVLSSPANCF